MRNPHRDREDPVDRSRRAPPETAKPTEEVDAGMMFHSMCGTLSFSVEASRLDMRRLQPSLRKPTAPVHGGHHGRSPSSIL